MNDHVRGIDHLMIVVADLDRAFVAFSRLGFMLQPRGDHEGRGTSNHVFLAGNAYCELFFMRPPAAVSPRYAHLLKYGEGFWGVSVATGDAHNFNLDCRSRGIPVSSVEPISRPLPELSQVAAFNVFHFEVEEELLAVLFACEHRTPELVYRPGYNSHPNGTYDLSHVTFVAADPFSSASEIARKLGVTIDVQANGAPTDGTARIVLGKHCIVFMTPERFRHEHAMDSPNIESIPSPASITFRVESYDKISQFLKRGGVPYFSAASGSIIVEPQQACGAVLRFIAAETNEESAHG